MKRLSRHVAPRSKADDNEAHESSSARMQTPIFKGLDRTRCNSCTERMAKDPVTKTQWSNTSESNDELAMKPTVVGSLLMQIPLSLMDLRKWLADNPLQSFGRSRRSPVELSKLTLVS